MDHNELRPLCAQDALCTVYTYTHTLACGTAVLSVAEAFWIGAFAKAVATVATYPYIRAKVLLQRKRPADGDGADAYDAASATGILRQVWAKEGAPGLYRGMRPQLVKGVTNAALMLVIKERIGGAVRARILGARATRKID